MKDTLARRLNLAAKRRPLARDKNQGRGARETPCRYGAATRMHGDRSRPPLDEGGTMPIDPWNVNQW